MLVRITDIVESGPRTVVSFSCLFGNAVGFWEGEVPLVDHDYYVEIEIDGILRYGLDIEKSSAEKFSIHQKNNRTYITGRLGPVNTKASAAKPTFSKMPRCLENLIST